MAYDTKTPRPCAGCGHPTIRRENNTRKPLCIPCAIQKMIDVQTQMHNHSGPHYDAWLRSLVRYADRQGRTGGDPSKLLRDQPGPQ